MVYITLQIRLEISKHLKQPHILDSTNHHHCSIYKCSITVTCGFITFKKRRRNKESSPVNTFSENFETEQKQKMHINHENLINLHIANCKKVVFVFN